MLKQIEKFQKEAKALGRNENSVEELKIWITAQEESFPKYVKQAVSPKVTKVVVSPGEYKVVQYTDNIPTYTQEVRELENEEEAIIYEYNRLLGIFDVELDDGTIIEISEGDYVFSEGRKEGVKWGS